MTAGEVKVKVPEVAYVVLGQIAAPEPAEANPVF